MSEATLDLIRKEMRSGIRPAGAGDRVCNDECAFSFDTPFSPDGVYVSLKSYQAFGHEYVQLDRERTGCRLYVRIKHTRVPKPAAEDVTDSAPTKLAIGGEGGFKVNEDKYDTVKEHSLVLLGEPGTDNSANVSVSLPCIDLPQLIIDACDALISKKSHLAEEQQAAVAWDFVIKETKYANDLIQLPATNKISPNPKDWHCVEEGVVMRENLWMNLSDGHIGSGRRQYDGSGGKDGALNHYRETKTANPPHGFPLVVKLGTITPHGADVYSYAPDEDDQVTDPKLAEHLAHWGINMMTSIKTEQTMEELQVAANLTLELDKITEAGKDLQPLSGAGYVGLRNLGNSCYMNSVLQALFSAPEVSGTFGELGPQLIKSAPEDPTTDLLCQLAKLRAGLCTDRYTASGEEEEAAVCVQPRMLKALVGKGHPEFSSSRQQDAQEYLQHLMELLRRAERTAGSRLGGSASFPPLTSLFSFNTEERIEADGMVAYKTNKGCTELLLPIPLEAATNRAEHLAYEERAKRQKLESAASKDKAAGGGEEETPVVPIVPFDACLSKLLAPEPMESFRGRASASKLTRLQTFPKYLIFQLARYYTSEDWQAKKLSVQVPMPMSVDLTALRAVGPQPGETLMPEEDAGGGGGGAAAPAPSAAVEPDETIVAQLLSMGFSENGCKRAAVATKNSTAEAAMEWVFAHMEDPDFNEPLPPPGAAAGGTDAPRGAGGGGAPDPEAIAMLGGMGFTEQQATAALAATQGNLERAADWLFSHADDLDAAVAVALGGGDVGGAGGGGDGDGGGGANDAPVSDGGGEYELQAIISHMGANTMCGHYVCHVHKEGRWVLYNDRKVAASETPPLDLGYMYVYRRKD